MTELVYCVTVAFPVVNFGMFLTKCVCDWFNCLDFLKPKGDFGKYEIYFNETFSGRVPRQDVRFLKHFGD